MRLIDRFREIVTQDGTKIITDRAREAEPVRMAIDAPSDRAIIITAIGAEIMRTREGGRAVAEIIAADILKAVEAQGFTIERREP